MNAKAFVSKTIVSSVLSLFTFVFAVPAKAGGLGTVVSTFSLSSGVMSGTWPGGSFYMATSPILFKMSNNPSLWIGTCLNHNASAVFNVAKALNFNFTADNSNSVYYYGGMSCSDWDSPWAGYLPPNSAFQAVYILDATGFGVPSRITSISLLTLTVPQESYMTITIDGKVGFVDTAEMAGVAATALMTKTPVTAYRNVFNYIFNPTTNQMEQLQLFAYLQL